MISLKDLPGEGRQELQGVIRDLKLSALEGIPVIPIWRGYSQRTCDTLRRMEGSPASQPEPL